MCAAIRCPPCGQGTAPSFYRTRGGDLQLCHTVLKLHMAVWRTTLLMVVLTNLTPSGRHGESCACLGATSRVAVWASPAWFAVRTLVRGCN
jgi:hypothetical protein